MVEYGNTDRLTGGTITACNATNVANLVDNNDDTFWSHVAASPHWIKYDCGVGVTWVWGKFRCKNHATVGFKDFNVTGSNDDSSYDTLYSGTMAQSANWQEFTWVNTTAYRYIKINITSQYDTGTPQVIAYEIEAMEMLPSKGGFFPILCEAWERNKKLWQPKLLLPKEGFSY